MHERLQGLRRPPAGVLLDATSATTSGSDALGGLERALVGEAGDGLTLKQRLERLVAAASRRSAERAERERPRPAPVPLEELIQGRRVENERGEFFLVEGDLHAETFHGDVSFSRFAALDAGTVAVLAGEPELADFDLRGAAFLDTETTGLAGGAGTAAFLVGLGYLEGERFVVRQYFMRDYHEEPALLHGLARDLARFRRLVTFNGRSFDVPLLESRYRLNRLRYPLEDAPHLDLLPPARRLWKERLESCALQSLEAALLGLRRRGDVAGEEIPRIYFDFVRSRDARALARVLEHNRLDVLSLAALAVLACQWVDEARAEDPRDVFSLARVYERAALHDRSEAQYRRVLDSCLEPLRTASLLRLADRARRRRDHPRAVAWWEEAARAGDWSALRCLAIHHEHRSRDLAAALERVEHGLHRLSDEAVAPRLASDLRRRHRRLLAKLARAGAGSPATG